MEINYKGAASMSNDCSIALAASSLCCTQLHDVRFRGTTQRHQFTQSLCGIVVYAVELCEHGEQLCVVAAEKRVTYYYELEAVVKTPDTHQP